MPFEWWCCADAKASGGTIVVPSVGSTLSDGRRPGADEVLPVDLNDEEGPAAKLWPAAAAERADECTVRLTRPDVGSSWGILLEVTPAKDVLVISGIPDTVAGAETAMQAHNRRAPAAQRVLTGDFIVSVSGRTDAAGMTQLLLNELEVTLMTRRPVIHKVAVPKNGRPLGFSLRYLESGASVYIGAIEPGGAGAAARVDVVVGDRIVEVNGRTGAAEMVAALKSSPRPEISISRLR